MEELLKRLKQEELLRLEGQKDKIDVTYKYVPSALERASKLLNMDKEEIIHVCALASRNYANMEWYHMLDHVVTFMQCRAILNENQ